MFERWIEALVPGAVRDYVLDVGYGLRHPSLLTSGATEDEADGPLPGDDLVDEPMWMATRGVTIDAPATHVWPWLAQMGWGRGGWYWWADPFREGRASASEILPAFQHVRVGDVLLDGPGCHRTKGAWAVRSVEPGCSIVLYSARDPISGLELDMRAPPSRWIDCSWAFALVPHDERTTRLLIRTRVSFAPPGRPSSCASSEPATPSCSGPCCRGSRSAPNARPRPTGRPGGGAGGRLVTLEPGTSAPARPPCPRARLDPEVSKMMILGMPIPFPSNITPAAQTASDWWVLAGIAIAAVLVAVVMCIAIITGRRRSEGGAEPHDAREGREAHDLDEVTRRAA